MSGKPDPRFPGVGHAQKRQNRVQWILCSPNSFSVFMLVIFAQNNNHT
jgi:hypothetical protein